MQPTKHVGMCRPTNLFWDQPSSLESSSWTELVPVRSCLKFRHPNSENCQIITLLSPTSHQVDFIFFSGSAKISGENSLEAGITPKKRWTTRNRQPLAAPRPTKIHGLQSLQRASCGKKRCQRERDPTHPWTKVVFWKSHSNYTTRFFKHVPKLKSITCFLLTFKLAFFLLNFQAAFLLVYIIVTWLHFL